MSNYSNDEQSLFSEMMEDVKPLAQDTVLTLNKTKNQENRLARQQAATALNEMDEEYLSLDNAPMVHPDDVIGFKGNGVQDGVFRKVRLGRYPIQAKLDLHKRSLQQARDELVAFFRQCIRMDIRTVILIHGKGANANPPALMKSYINFWLQQISDVQCFHSAQPQHGGTGAVYVLLKKSPEKKLENRERHQKRRS
jgi:DNA-nicking Smr family endonuclease